MRDLIPPNPLITGVLYHTSSKGIVETEETAMHSSGSLIITGTTIAAVGATTKTTRKVLLSIRVS